jgi:hypothetical protein
VASTISDGVAIVRKHHNVTIGKHLEGQLRGEQPPRLYPPRLPFALQMERAARRAFNW